MCVASEEYLPLATTPARMYTAQDLQQKLIDSVSSFPLVHIKGSVGPGIIIGVVGSLYYVPSCKASVASIIYAHIIWHTTYTIEGKIAAIDCLPESERQYFEGAVLRGRGMGAIPPNNHWPQKACYLNDAYSLICEQSVIMPDHMGGFRTIQSVVIEITKITF